MYPCVLGIDWSGFPRVWVFSKPKNKARLSGVPGMTSLLSGLLSCPHPTLTQAHQKRSLPDSLLLWCPSPRAANSTSGLPGPSGRESLEGEVADHPGGREGPGPSPLLQALARSQLRVLLHVDQSSCCWKVQGHCLHTWFLCGPCLWVKPEDPPHFGGDWRGHS